MTNIGLIPNSSYNDFVLGSNISNYMDRGHTKKTYHESVFTNDSYHFIKEDIEVWCELDGQINTIRCSSSCIYKGVELIGLEFSKFISLVEKVPDDNDVVYLSREGHRGQNQHVYDFDNKVREIMNLPKRPYDQTHNKMITTNISGNVWGY